MVSALGASWGSLGTFLAHLVGLLVALGASLGASWDLLGLLGRLLVPLGASLGPCWGLLVVLGASLGASWDLLGLCLPCLSLASPGPGGWPVYASVPGPGPGSGPGPGLGPVLTLLTVALAPTRWSSLGGPQWKVLNEFP